MVPCYSEVVGPTPNDDKPPSTRETVLDTVEIFGTRLEDLSRPLAPQRIDKQILQDHSGTDVTQVLRQSSGVYVRQEDGEGLRPNIGLRGTSPDRSKKIVFMEDAVLIGPAPYAAPAAYYTPSLLMTESLEIYKGFAALPFGPNSIGGAINYLTPDLPPHTQTAVMGAFGSFNTGKLRLSHGGPLLKRFGYLVQVAGTNSDGFKQIDGGGDTGYEQKQALLKLAATPSDRQSFNILLSYGDEKSNETYLGLTSADFERKPNRRYVASAKDQMKWQHTALRVKHSAALTAGLSLETTAYRHEFQRVWMRLDRFDTATVNLRSVLNKPSSFNQNHYQILNGDRNSATLGAAGNLVIANNDRSYVSQGLQGTLYWDWQANGEERARKSAHSSEFKWRFHEDFIRRRHSSEKYQMNNRRLQRVNDSRSTDTDNKDRARAWTLSALDNWQLGPVTLTPAVRFESVHFESEDWLTSTQHQRHDPFVVGGLATAFEFSPGWSTRYSVNQAVTVAGLNLAGKERREEATNYEWQIKHSSFATQEFDFLLFFNDYRNLTGTCSTSGGCGTNQLDKQFNGGRASIYGGELGWARLYNLGVVHIPVRASATWLTAQFASTFVSDNPEWGLGLVRKGAPLPYVPEAQYSLSLGAQFRKVRQELELQYQSRVYDQAVAEERIAIKSYGVIDWSLHYKFAQSNQISFKVENVLAKTYAVSARPFGFRPGKPQSFQVSLDWQF